MLKTLKKNKNLKNIFYGINSGNYGFLMNKFSKEKIIKNLNKSKVTTIYPLEMKVINNKNSVKNYLAINEVSILRQSRQAANLSIKLNSKYSIAFFERGNVKMMLKDYEGAKSDLNKAFDLGY